LWPGQHSRTTKKKEHDYPFPLDYTQTPLDILSPFYAKFVKLFKDVALLSCFSGYALTPVV
jgi:hypothetical protein